VVGAYYFTEHATEICGDPLTNQWNIDGTAYTIRSPIVTGTVTSANSGYQQTAPSCANTLTTLFPNSCQFITRRQRGVRPQLSVFGNLTYTPDWAESSTSRQVAAGPRTSVTARCWL